MPVKRRKPKIRAHRITSEAVAAFRAGDEYALAQALALPPWHASPLWTNNACPYPEGTSTSLTWAKATELRKQLEAASAR